MVSSDCAVATRSFHYGNPSKVTFQCLVCKFGAWLGKKTYHKLLKRLKKKALVPWPDCGMRCNQLIAQLIAALQQKFYPWHYP